MPIRITSPLMKIESTKMVNEYASTTLVVQMRGKSRFYLPHTLYPSPFPSLGWISFDHGLLYTIPMYSRQQQMLSIGINVNEVV